MTNEPQDKPPRYRVPTKLYLLAAGVMAMWVFVTFFLRNPYTQATQGDYYDTHSYGEFAAWALVLVGIPMIGLAAYLAWTRRGRG